MTYFDNRITKITDFQIQVGDDDDGDDDDGRISPEHPSPILHAPRDIISRKGKSLTPIKGTSKRSPPFLKLSGNKWYDLIGLNRNIGITIGNIWG